MMCVKWLADRVQILVGVQPTGHTLLYMRRYQGDFSSSHLVVRVPHVMPQERLQPVPSTTPHVPFSRASTRQGAAKCDTPQCDTGDPKGGGGIGTSDAGSLVVTTRTNINRGGA